MAHYDWSFLPLQVSLQVFGLLLATLLLSLRPLRKTNVLVALWFIGNSIGFALVTLANVFLVDYSHRVAGGVGADLGVYMWLVRSFYGLEVFLVNTIFLLPWVTVRDRLPGRRFWIAVGALCMVSAVLAIIYLTAPWFGFIQHSDAFRRFSPYSYIVLRTPLRLAFVIATFVFLHAWFTARTAAEEHQSRYFLMVFASMVTMLPLEQGNYVGQMPSTWDPNGWLYTTGRWTYWSANTLLWVACLSVVVGIVALLVRRRVTAPRTIPRALAILAFMALAAAWVYLPVDRALMWQLIRPAMLTFGIVATGLIAFEPRRDFPLVAACALAAVVAIFLGVGELVKNATDDVIVATGIAFGVTLLALGAFLWPLFVRLLDPTGDEQKRRDMRVYRQAVEQAAVDGRITPGADAVLAALRGRLAISDREHALELGRLRQDMGTDVVAGRLVLGRYRLDSVLGEGGQGRTFLAYDQDLDRPVVLKASLEMDEGRMEGLLREAKILAKVQHPGIAQVYGVERIGHEAVLVLEYIEGDALEDRIAAGPLPPTTVARVATDVLGGLGAAHAAGIVHGDVKPANILVRPDGSAVLVDFGIARHEDDGVTLLAKTQQDAGTLRYMAPEQVRGEPLDGRTDLYALGAVLIRCLTGAGYLPFGGSAFDQRMAILEDEPDLDSVPAAWADLLADLLAKEPEGRPADAETVMASVPRAS